MDVLAIVALIALVVLGLMVLRVKSDPMESKAVRKSLADDASQDSESVPPIPKTKD